VELLHLLQKSNAPISMYDKVQKWARKSFAINQDVFSWSHMSRKKVLQLVEKKFDAAGWYPQSSTLYLPYANRRITIQTYDFSQAVYSLLTDPVLMREENLDLATLGDQEDNPLYPFPKPAMYSTRTRDFEFKEFTDGELYCIAYDKYCREKNVNSSLLHMPLIIICQLDKTFIDSKGKLTLEPFKISLHIFKEKVRRLDIAWRPLGYISNQANLPKYKLPQDKASDYHSILGLIMKSFKSYQDMYDVFLWDMHIHESIHHIAFKPLFGYIIGDNEGHDKTCGKFLNRMNVQRLCRCCDTLLDKSDDPFFVKWKYTEGSHIANLVSKRKTDDLKEMSYHCINNAMTGLQFADAKRGINGATPAERLHLLNHGLFQLILEYNFGQKRAKTTQRNISTLLSDSTEDHNNNPDDDNDLVDEDVMENSLLPQVELSNVSLFTSNLCDKFDSDAKAYGRILQKQSSRYWNRSFFYQGITSNSKKVGHEERNCLMLCLLIYTSSCHEFYTEILDPIPSKKRKTASLPDRSKRLDFLIELISETLLLENFMMEKTIKKSTLMIFQKYIPFYLNFLKEVCPRESGMGWKLTKFHILLHLFDDIKRFSIPLNFDSNVVESHHKQEKKSGNRTQMRASTLEKQTAERRTEHMLIQRAYNDMYPPDSIFLESHGDFDVTNSQSDQILSSMKMTYVQDKGLCFTNKNGMATAKVSKFPEHVYLVRQINEFFHDFFITTQLPANGAEIYTRLTTESINADQDDAEEAALYRGDPFWTSRHTGETVERTSDLLQPEPTLYDPWHDFAYVKWRTNISGSGDDSYTIIPARILFFFSIPDGCEGIDKDSIVYTHGSYAMVQSCVEDLTAEPPTNVTAINYYAEKYGTHSPFPNYLAHPSCSILFWTVMEWTSYQSDPNNSELIRVPELYITSIENLCGSCIAVPYDLTQKPTIEWIIIRNRDGWDESFVNDMEVRLDI
jgi:hypothetical protein